MGLSYVLMLVAFYVDNGKQLVGVPLIVRALL
jgi:hypothetical protein